MSILFFFISLIASVGGAVSGIGGGIIIKPVLDATNTLGVSTISFLSGCTVLTMTTVSLIKSRKNSVKLDGLRSVFLALGGAVGGVAGKLLFDLIKRALGQENIVGAVQSVILLVMTVGVFIYVKNKARIQTKTINSNALALGIGLLLGLISAFLGIGGGPMNIAVLCYFFSMDTKSAALNSLFIIFLSQMASLISTAASGSIPAFDPLVLGLMVLGGVLGGLVGSVLSKRMSEKQVDAFFSWMLAVIACINVYNIVRFLI